MQEIQGQITLEFPEIDSAELNINIPSVRKFDKIAGNVILLKKALGITADFHIQFNVEFVCSRCLCPFNKEFDEEYHLIYISGKDPLLSYQKVELKPGDIDRVYYNGNTIDLEIGIRESIILAIPNAPVCKEDCQGLCPVCGKNLNKEKCNCKILKPAFFTPIPKKKKT